MSQLNWQKRYQVGDTPWDKGGPHPVLPSFVSLHRRLFQAGQNILIPGCGYGYDAAELALDGASITALDIAEAPIEKAKQLHSAHKIDWEIGDYFSLPENDPSRLNHYDLIWEHTCFCAIPLDLRQDYVTTAAKLLKPHGLLAAVFFLNPDHTPEDGPPFGVTRAELNERFSPFFELLWDLPPTATYHGREGRETVMLWRRRKHL